MKMIKIQKKIEMDDELIQKQMDSLILTKKADKKEITKKELDEILDSIKKVRKEIWSKKYAKSLS